MKEYYKKGVGMYALYRDKNLWRESASVTNDQLLDERKFELEANGYYYKIQQEITTNEVNNMSHYKEELEQWGRERSAIYEEEKMAEAFKDAPVIDCTSESNDKELLMRELKKQIEENARLHMELAKMRSWKEKVLNLINEKMGLS